MTSNPGSQALPPQTASPKPKSVVVAFLTYVGMGLLATMLLLGGKLLFESSSGGIRAERIAIEILQKQLPPFDPKKELPVVVIDIGQQPGGTATTATSRAYLKSIVGALVERGPSAIAIDEDFSTNGTGWVTDDDADFLAFCLRMKQKGVPVFLGVHDGRAGGPESWLGLPENKEMAVALLGPRGDPSRMPLWIQYPNVNEKLPSLSSALAREYLKSAPAARPKPPSWLSWAVSLTPDNTAGLERHVIEDRSEYQLAETLVNYSKLELLQKLTLPTVNPDFIAHSQEMFRDKMVLIGAASYATDASNVPGRDHTVPGVFLHACTAYTLAREPLYEFESSVRVFVDLIISFLVLLALAILRSIHLKRGQQFPLHQWHRRIIWPMVAVVIVAGISLVRWGHVMWLDFFLVIAALLMHPNVEHAAKLIGKSLWGKLSTAFHPPQPAGGQPEQVTGSVAPSAVVAPQGEVNAAKPASGNDSQPKPQLAEHGETV